MVDLGYIYVAVLATAMLGAMAAALLMGMFRSMTELAWLIVFGGICVLYVVIHMR